MKTLPRGEAGKLWNQYWSNMKQEWFKIEVLQDYSGEDDSPSLRAWLADDKQKGLELLKQEAQNNSWRKLCEQKHKQGVLMRRIRIIEKPFTLYTEWELEYYKLSNIPGGEQIFIVDKKDVKGFNLPSGDLMMFDNRRAAVCAYDETGRMVRQTFYDESDNLTRFLELKRSLLHLISVQ